MDFGIVRNAGHYDVYIEGEFYCTSDTYSEAIEEVDFWIENRRKELENSGELVRI